MITMIVGVTAFSTGKFSFKYFNLEVLRQKMGR
jgi:hypothetical protein